MKWMSLLGFVFIIGNIKCDPKPCSKPSQGPPPKVLADVFTAKVELKKDSDKQVIFLEEHYNKKLKLFSLEVKSHNSTKRTIVDFNTNQITEIIFKETQGICTIKNNDELEEYFPGVHIFNGDHIFSIGQLFGMSADYLHIFQGNFTLDNGIQVDRWDFCIAESDSTYKYAHVYYSVVGWIVPALITRTPVRVEVTSVEQGKETKWYYDIASYQPNIVDPEKFQVPEGIFCSGRKTTKPFPGKLQSNNFYFRTENIIKPHKQVQWTDEWFFLDEGLARIDFVNPESTETGYNIRSEIIDYKNRKVYIVLPFSSVPCVFEDFKNASIAEGNTASITSLLRLHVQNSQDFFGSNINYNYIGQRETRSLITDVWQAQRTDWPTASPQVTSLWEWYFTTDSFIAIEDTAIEKNISARLVIMIKEVKGTVEEGSVLKKGTKIVHNIYGVNFISGDEQLDLSIFDIGSCYSLIAKLHLQFSVNVKDEKESILFHHLYSIKFRNVWRKALAQAADTSLLAISELEVIPETDAVLIRFQLLDSNTGIREMTTLNERRSAITQKLNSNQLVIDWTTQDKKKIQLHGNPYSLKDVVCRKPKPLIPTPPPTIISQPETGYSGNEMAANGIGCWFGGFLLSAGITFGLRRRIHFV